MRVKSCVASDGANHIIQLTDEHGCVLRPRMISRFLKAKISDERASVITYAFFHAFKFPDALSVHVKCKVEICRSGCLDHCHSADSPNSHVQDVHASFDEYNSIERTDSNLANSKEMLANSQSASVDVDNELLFDDKSTDRAFNNTNNNEPYTSHLRGKSPSASPKPDDPTTQSSIIREMNDMLSVSHSVLASRDGANQNVYNMQPVRNILYFAH